MNTNDFFKAIEGKITASIFDTRDAKASKLEREIEHHIQSNAYAREDNQSIRARLQRAHRLVYEEMLRDFRNLFLVREYAGNNLVTTRGRSVIADRLSNVTTYTGIINYGALGSSATAAANADTQLGTEVFRKVTASTSTSSNISFIDFFYSKSDTNGTYQEFGTFIDGTGTVNTGRIFNHFITGGWAKSSSESMTVSCQFTIS